MRRGGPPSRGGRGPPSRGGRGPPSRGGYGNSSSTGRPTLKDKPTGPPTRREFRTRAELEVFLGSFSRMPPDQLVHELGGPSNDNLGRLLEMIGQFPSSTWNIQLLPIIFNEHVLSDVRMEQVARIVTQFARPAALMSFNTFIATRFPLLLDDPAIVQAVLSLCDQLITRVPEVAVATLPIDDIVRHVVDDSEGTKSTHLSRVAQQLQQRRNHHRDALRSAAAAQASDEETQRRLRAGAQAASAEGFREVPPFPTSADVLGPPPRDLPANRMPAIYSSIDAYLGTHYLLLREDALASLREGIHKMREGRPDSDLRGLVRLYRGATVVGIDSSRSGHSWQVELPSVRGVRWASSRRLLPGSLLCLLPANVPPARWTEATFATVSTRPDDSLPQGSPPIVGVTLVPESAIAADPLTSSWLLVESAVFFEPYRWVLTALLGIAQDTTKLPFAPLLLGSNMTPHPPKYLVMYDDEHIEQTTRATGAGYDTSDDDGHDTSDDDNYDTDIVDVSDGETSAGPSVLPIRAEEALKAEIAKAENEVSRSLDETIRARARKTIESARQTLSTLEKAAPQVYFFGSTFPKLEATTGRRTLDVLAPWPVFQSGLDASQQAALRALLTHEVALVQGPPGCGKTYVSVIAARLLLANARSREPRVAHPLSVENAPASTASRRPILFVCFTNHALDQLLEHVMKFEPNVVRVGSRCKSEALIGRNLQVLRQQSKHRPFIKALVEERECLLKKAASAFNRGADAAAVNAWAVLDAVMKSCSWAAPQIASLLSREALIDAEVKAYEAQKGKPKTDTEGFERVGRKGKNKRGLEMNDVVIRWLHRENAPKTHFVRRGSNIAVLLRPEAHRRQGELFFEHADPLAVNVEGGHGGALEAAMLEADEANIGDEEDEDEVAEQIALRLDAGGVAEIADYERGRFGRGTQPQTEGTRRAPFNSAAEPGWKDTMAARKKRDHKNKKLNLDISFEGQDVFVNRPEPPMTADELRGVTDVWSLNLANREALAALWLAEVREAASRKFLEACKAIDDLSKEINRQYDVADASILRSAAVVGMTTTAAARMRALLERVAPTVVIVEEAAEVLECHVLASLPMHSVQHLLLIGDHKQLRPSVERHELVKKGLDISMFERLINNGASFVTLSTQHRMRPEIANLVRPMYPRLVDAPNVLVHPSVKGMATNLFFISHTAPEQGAGVESMSRCNPYEANMSIQLAGYLLRNGYGPERVVLLTTYLGQQQLLRELLRAEVARRPKLKGIRVATVDGYQGEEADVVILSLVRSTAPVGFIRTANRACVALSRARHGMYILGNGRLLSESGELWGDIMARLGAESRVGDSLLLRCAKHPDTDSRICVPGDFLNVRDGGCNRLCGARLNCGHACTQQCHPDDLEHTEFKCLKPCTRSFEGCGHPCEKKCHLPCGLCTFLVLRVLPRCGHTMKEKCYMPINEILCKLPCPRRPEGWTCDHPCPNKCSMKCPAKCNTYVSQTCALGHVTQLLCHEPLVCRHQCVATLPCGHQCVGTCSECSGDHHARCRQPCQRTLPCGHPCGDHPCSDACPPCTHKCSARCEHSVCNALCRQLCQACMEPCVNKCPHRECSRRCGEACDVEPCSEPCNRSLRCGHQCMGFCGERCPTICRVCDENWTDPMTLEPLSEADHTLRLVLLPECQHVFSAEALDHYVRTQDPASALDAAAGDESAAPNRVQLLQCPLCRCPIQTASRYKAAVRRCRQQVVAVTYASDALALEVLRIVQSAAQRRDTNASITALQNAREYASTHTQMAGQGATVVAEAMREVLDVPQSGVNEMVAVTAAENAIRLCETITPSSRQVVWMRLALRTRALIAKRKSDWETVRAIMTRIRALSTAHDMPALTGTASETVSELAIDKELDELDVVSALFEKDRGYAYTCPNGHLYFIGECGGAMERSICPDCSATIGGGGHMVAQGNARAEGVDGRGATSWEQMHARNPAPNAQLVRRIQLGLD